MELSVDKAIVGMLLALSVLATGLLPRAVRASFAAGSAAGRAGVHCPQALRYGSRAPEAVLQAVRSEIAMVRRDAGQYQIIGVASLAEVAAKANGSSSYRYQAAYMCGKAVAERSWFVTIYFPQYAHSSSPEGFAFVARTINGWRIWHVPLGI